MMRRVIQGAVRGAFERVLDYLHVGENTPFGRAILSAIRTETAGATTEVQLTTIAQLNMTGSLQGYAQLNLAENRSGAADVVSGMLSIGRNASTSLVQVVSGVNAQAQIIDTGDATITAAFVAEQPYLPAAGQPVTNFGLWIKEQAVPGSVSWAIGSNATCPSFLQGELRVGAVADDGSGAILQLTGKANASGGYQLAGGATITTGSGSPEGAVTATPGSIYCRTNGTVWRKASGSGNTGWVDMGAADPAFFAVNPAVPAVSVDWANGKAQKVDLLLATGATTMNAPTGSTDGLEVTLMLIPRGYAVTWDAAWKLPTWAEVDPSTGTYTMARWKYDGSTLRLISFLTGLPL
jgi:hypothetical protein